MKPAIMIVDDDPMILELLRFNVENEGYDAYCFGDGESALRALSTLHPDVVLLDVMLPGIDGLEVCRRMRSDSKTAGIPVIMLTARGEETDRVVGLELGADDYVVKPFGVRELMARIKSMLRRFKKANAIHEGEVLRLGDLELDPERRSATRGGRSIELSMKEFDLLAYLLAHPGKVHTREALLDRVWGYEYVGQTRTVDVHIRHLRKKIESDPENPQIIQTVRGIGYRLNN